jgi:hypothetical protein
MTLRARRLIVAAPIAELLAVLGMLVPGGILFGSLDATSTGRMVEAQRLALWTAPTAGYVFCLLGAWWVARRANDAHERNGLALGVVVALIDFALLIASGAPFGVLMLSSVTARIAGGYCGGVLAKRATYRPRARGTSP